MKQTIVTTSWDDGHILDLKLADLLRKYKLPATFYVSPKDHEFKEQDRLTKEQIAQLGHDFEIGAHTVTHPLLSKITNEVARGEIVGSKKMLEEILGREVKSFCYPSGDYTQAHERIVRESGFAVARTINRFATDIGSDPYAIPTTVHAYRHWSDASPIFENAGSAGFMSQYLNWDELAISLFDKTVKEGGVFHIWGHSWEIDANGDWDRLERVFKHISGRSDVRYVTNAELI